MDLFPKKKLNINNKITHHTSISRWYIKIIC
jgi:hypothetical protein